jgi:type VI secretion system secreted protein VgrG
LAHRNSDRLVDGTKAKIQDTFKIIAAKGNMKMQAQAGKIKATAQQNVEITSVNGKVLITAPEEILLAAGGGYIRIGKNIEIHNPGTQSQKAASFALSGPTSMPCELPRLPKAPIEFDPAHLLFSQQFDLSHLIHHDEELGYVTKNKMYTVYDKQNNLIATGVIGDDGITDRIFTNESKDLVLVIDEGEWTIEEYIEAHNDLDGDIDEGEPA